MHKYEVEYLHKVNIIDEGSSLRSRLMKCTECGLFIEISDGHIIYLKDGVEISSCRDPSDGSASIPPGACLGWPAVPECGVPPLCKKDYLTKKIIDA